MSANKAGAQMAIQNGYFEDVGRVGVLAAAIDEVIFANGWLHQATLPDDAVLALMRNHFRALKEQIFDIVDAAFESATELRALVAKLPDGYIPEEKLKVLRDAISSLLDVPEEKKAQTE